MITLHSINAKSIDEPCFAKLRNGGCRALAVISDNCGRDCPFYKPTGCKDWVRIEDKMGVNFIPPEEYRDYYRRKHEQRADLPE